MSCNVFIEAFEKNFKFSLAPEEKQEFCIWVSEKFEEGKLNFQTLLIRSPEPICSNLNEIQKSEGPEKWALQDALEILIDTYTGSCMGE